MNNENERKEATIDLNADKEENLDAVHSENKALTQNTNGDNKNTKGNTSIDATNNSLNTSKRIKQNSRVRNKDSYKAYYNDKLNFNYDWAEPGSISRNPNDMSARMSIDSEKDDITSRSQRYKSFIESQDNALRNKLNARNSKFTHGGNNQGRNKSAIIGSMMNNKTSDNLMNFASERGSLSLKASIIEQNDQMDNLNFSKIRGTNDNLADSAVMSISPVSKSGTNINFDDLLKSQDDINELSHRGARASNRENNISPDLTDKQKDKQKLTENQSKVTPVKQNKTQVDISLNKSNDMNKSASNKILPKSNTSRISVTSTKPQRELTEKEKFMLAVKNKKKSINKTQEPSVEEIENITTTSARTNYVPRNVEIISKLKNNMTNQNAGSRLETNRSENFDDLKDRYLTENNIVNVNNMRISLNENDFPIVEIGQDQNNLQQIVQENKNEKLDEESGDENSPNLVIVNYTHTEEEFELDVEQNYPEITEDLSGLSKNDRNLDQKGPISNSEEPKTKKKVIIKKKIINRSDKDGSQNYEAKDSNQEDLDKINKNSKSRKILKGKNNVEYPLNEIDEFNVENEDLEDSKPPNNLKLMLKNANNKENEVRNAKESPETNDNYMISFGKLTFNEDEAKKILLNNDNSKDLMNEQYNKINNMNSQKNENKLDYQENQSSRGKDQISKNKSEIENENEETLQNRLTFGKPINHLSDAIKESENLSKNKQIGVPNTFVNTFSFDKDYGIKEDSDVNEIIKSESACNEGEESYILENKETPIFKKLEDQPKFSSLKLENNPSSFSNDGSETSKTVNLESKDLEDDTRNTKTGGEMGRNNTELKNDSKQKKMTLKNKKHAMTNEEGDEKYIRNEFDEHNLNKEGNLQKSKRVTISSQRYYQGEEIEEHENEDEEESIRPTESETININDLATDNDGKNIRLNKTNQIRQFRNCVLALSTHFSILNSTTKEDEFIRNNQIKSNNNLELLSASKRIRDYQISHMNNIQVIDDINNKKIQNSIPIQSKFDNLPDSRNKQLNLLISRENDIFVKNVERVKIFETSKENIIELKQIKKKIELLEIRENNIELNKIQKPVILLESKENNIELIKLNRQLYFEMSNQNNIQLNRVNEHLNFEINKENNFNLLKINKNAKYEIKNENSIELNKIRMNSNIFEISKGYNIELHEKNSKKIENRITKVNKFEIEGTSRHKQPNSIINENRIEILKSKGEDELKIDKLEKTQIIYIIKSESKFELSTNIEEKKLKLNQNNTKSSPVVLKISSTYPNKREVANMIQVYRNNEFNLLSKIQKTNVKEELKTPISIREIKDVISQTRASSFSINSKFIHDNSNNSPQSKKLGKMYISSPSNSKRENKENLLPLPFKREKDISVINEEKDKKNTPNIQVSNKIENKNILKEKIISNHQNISNMNMNISQNSSNISPSTIGNNNSSQISNDVIENKNQNKVNKYKERLGLASINNINELSNLVRQGESSSNLLNRDRKFSDNNKKYQNKSQNNLPNLSKFQYQSNDEIEINDEILYEFKEKYFGKMEFLDKEMLIQFYKKYMRNEFNSEMVDLFGEENIGERGNNILDKMSQKELIDYMKRNNKDQMKQDEIENKNTISKLKKMLDIQGKENKFKSNNKIPVVYPKSGNASQLNVNLHSPNGKKSKKFLFDKPNNLFGIMPSNQVDPSNSLIFLPISIKDNLK